VAVLKTNQPEVLMPQSKGMAWQTFTKS